MSETTYTLVLKNNLSQIQVPSNKLTELYGKGLLTEEHLRQFSIVLDEMLNNCISYAFADDEEHDIEVKIVLSTRKTSIIITDDGIPHNPFTAEPPDIALGVEERSIGGLGVHIVKTIMDECSYERHGNKNVVTMIKYNEEV